MIILINSSKTMRLLPQANVRAPIFIKEATYLQSLLARYSTKRLSALMHLSPSLALGTKELLARWSARPETPALDAFIGDIYRGLQAEQFTPSQREYADQHLRILSGLYGILRPLDGICPYRLEMEHPLMGAGFKNLYQFWGDRIAQQLPEQGPILNLASIEYSRPLIWLSNPERVIAPLFLSQKRFVAVHAKVARGAFARWMLTTRPADFHQFRELGYSYCEEHSLPQKPAFCRLEATMKLTTR